MADSIFGFTAGALSLSTIWTEISITKSLSAIFVEKSARIAALRFAGALTGLAGGLINYIALQRKIVEQKQDGNSQSAELYRLSALAFVGTRATATLSGVGAVATTLRARAMGGAVLEAIAVRLGTGVVVGGFALTISGVGLVLLGVGVVAQVGAIVLTPDDFQRWLGRSYFGLDGGLIFPEKRADKFLDWKAELDELDKLIKPKQ